jgi:hypothetical protein
MQKQKEYIIELKVKCKAKHQKAVRTELRNCLFNLDNTHKIKGGYITVVL